MVRSPQDLSEDLSSHLLPSPGSQLRHRTTLTLQPSRGKTKFLLLPQHRKRCTESTKLGRLAVISCLKRGTSCSDAGNFKHWGWRWRTRADPESQSATRGNPLRSWSRGCGAGQRPRGKECPGTPRSRAGDPAGRRGVNTNPLPGDHTSASPRVPKTAHSPWGQGRKT